MNTNIQATGTNVIITMDTVTSFARRSRRVDSSDSGDGYVTHFDADEAAVVYDERYDEEDRSALAGIDQINEVHFDAGRLKPSPNTVTGDDLVVLRTRLGLTATEFAKRYRIPHRTYMRWESNESRPDAVHRQYLLTIAHDPSSVALIVQQSIVNKTRVGALDHSVA